MENYSINGNTRPSYMLSVNLYAGQEATVTTGCGAMDWFQLGKEYVEVVYCHPVYLMYIQSTSCEMPVWMKHNLEPRLM